MSTGYWQRTITNDAGDIIANAQIEVREPSADFTGTLVSLVDIDGAGLSNPFNADSEGFARFGADPQLVDIRATGSGSQRTWRKVPIKGTAATKDTDAFPYVTETITELKALPSDLLVDGARFDVNDVNDAGLRFYKWDAASTATADDIEVVEHTGTATGRFIALTGGGSGGGATGGGTDEVFYENDQTVTADYTVTSDRNAMTAGPIEIDDGVTVTVESGARWVVV